MQPGPPTDLERDDTVAVGDGDPLATGPTLAGDAAPSHGGDPRATGPTLAGEAGPSRDAAPATALGRTTRGGTTVLPRIEEREGQKVLVPRDAPRFAVDRVLGEGGMGVVELARDEDIGREVAIKRLRGEHGLSTNALARFVDEVRTVGRLDHPAIAPIHDVGVDADGSFFFVMKYVRGQTLEDVIDALKGGDAAAHRRFDFEQRVAIFLSVLHALDYAHAARLLHRDLKPANVMLGEYGEVLLMDWGIARPMGGAPDPIPEDAPEEPAEDAVTERLVATRAGAIIGTPLYMSPEQARGVTDQLDARSDLFAAALLFFELLTLRHPLEDQKTVPAICAGLQTFEPPPIYVSVWEHPDQKPVPSELRHFLHRALQREPDARWASASEMIAELERIRAGEFRVQCPATFMKRAQRSSLSFVDRHPILANVGVFGLALTLLGSVGGFLYLLLAG